MAALYDTDSYNSVLNCVSWLVLVYLFFVCVVYTCMCVCIFVYGCVCVFFVYGCVHIFVCVVFLYMCVHFFLCVCIFLFVWLCLVVCMHACVWVLCMCGSVYKIHWNQLYSYCKNKIWWKHKEISRNLITSCR